MDKYYDSIARGYDELYSQEQTHKLGIIVSVLEKNKFKLDSVLDVGSGTLLAYPFFSHLDYYALEPSKNLVNNSKYLAKIIGENIHIMTAEDFDYFPVSLILCLSVIHHVKKKDEVLKKFSENCDVCVISILKRYPAKALVKKKIETYFDIIHEHNESKDDILFCKPKLFK